MTDPLAAQRGQLSVSRPVDFLFSRWFAGFMIILSPLVVLRFCRVVKLAAQPGEMANVPKLQKLFGTASPPARVESACQTPTLIVSGTVCTEPSM